MIAAQLVGDTQDNSVNILSLNLTFLIQAALFLILLGILAKWVYPPIVEAADRRQRQIEDSVAQADEGRRLIGANQKLIEETLESARQEARSQIRAAQQAAALQGEVSRNTGRQRAQADIDTARTAIAGERASASGDLHSQVVTLVTAAATRLGGAAVDEQAAARAVSEVLR